jgi:hypothetical protein
MFSVASFLQRTLRLLQKSKAFHPGLTAKPIDEKQRTKSCSCSEHMGENSNIPYSRKT